jgi:hypothetical protein
MTEEQQEQQEQQQPQLQQQFVIPPMPEAPPPVPASEPPVPVRVRKDRRVLRAALRWTTAVVVFAAAGAGTAYGITQMKRTDVPGLATASDGRWDYPVITRPPLPSGSPGPFATDNKTNAHYADLRALLLPAPKGAKADASLRGTDGWLPTKTFLAQYTDTAEREELGQKLTDDGLRHIAARGWTTPDGTQTRIYLLQFSTAVAADELFSPGLISYDSPVYALTVPRRPPTTTRSRPRSSTITSRRRRMSRTSRSARRTSARRTSRPATPSA